MTNKKVIFDKKNVLVAGGAGFLGSHLCDELISSSKVICIDNFSTGDERNIDHLLSNPNFVFINYDLSSPIDLEKVASLSNFKINFQGIQEIYNLACPMSTKNFEANKEKTLLANSVVIKNLLDLADKYKSKFIHFSSSVVYGLRREEIDDYKVKESDMGQVGTISERSCYDEGKRFAESLVSTMGEIKKIDTKILRVFRTYGPRMKINDDQMIPDFITHALENKDLVVYGDDKFSSALCYVSDVVDAAIKMAESDLKGPINIGSDVDINLTEFAKMVIEATSSQSNIKYEEPKLFMTPLLLPDIHQARNDLGWMPIVTLEKGLEKTISNLRSQNRLRKV